MAIVVAEKMYIDYQNRKENGEIIKLGFATDADKDDKAFQKRKDTIDNWGSQGLYESYRTEDGSWKRREIPKQWKAEYLDNMPQRGFKVPNHVRRWGWGGGNVVWRIEDPRGFELEISSENMGQILMHCNIDRGEIKEECVWGWNKVGGSRIVLLPVDSEPYVEAMKDTKLRNATTSIKDVHIGDRILLKNGVEGIYYGGYYALKKVYLQQEVYGRAGDNALLTEHTVRRGYEGCKLDVVRRHVLKTDGGQWFVQSAFKVSAITQRYDEFGTMPIDPKDALGEINTSLREGGTTTDDPELEDSSYKRIYGTRIKAFALTKKEANTGKMKLIPASAKHLEQLLETMNTVGIAYDLKGRVLFFDEVYASKFENASSYYCHGDYLMTEYLDNGYIITQRKAAKPYMSANDKNDDELDWRNNVGRAGFWLALELDGRYYAC